MFDWLNTLYALPGILFGLTIHEFCHAFMAWKLGDNTAKEQGRLTLNPIKHIDLIGFLFIIIAGFGWAKPVQFDPGQLKNYRRDKALIAAAGPLSNAVIGLLLVLVIKSMLYLIVRYEVNTEGFLYHLFLTLYVGASINFGLFIFNLLPIPPLDGSHIVFSGLNIAPDLEIKIRKLGMPLLLLIIVFQNSTKITIIPIGFLVEKIMEFFVGW